MSKSILTEMKSLDKEALEALIQAAKSLAKEKRREEKAKKLPANDPDIAALNEKIREIVKKRGASTEQVIEALIRTTRMSKKFQYQPTEERVYRNPDNPFENWKGHGRMPGWMREKVDAGANAEDFLVRS